MPFLYMSRLPLELGTVSLIVLVRLSPAVQAETKTILSEAIYSMGDGETPSFAEAMVLQKAKQGALEEAGTYVESYTKVRNLDLNAEEIQTSRAVWFRWRSWRRSVPQWATVFSSSSRLKPQ